MAPTLRGGTETNAPSTNGNRSLMTTTTETKYTVEYFNQQVLEFVELCGRRTFWEAAQQVRDNAVKALGWVYMRTNDAEGWRFRVAIENYSHRDFHLRMNGMMPTEEDET